MVPCQDQNGIRPPHKWDHPLAFHSVQFSKQYLLSAWSLMLFSVVDFTCRQIHLTRHFSHASCTIHFMHITLHGSSVCVRASLHLHVIHDERLIVRSLSVSSCLSFSCFSPLFTSSLPHSTCTFFHVNSAKGNDRCAFAQGGVLPPGDKSSSHRF